MKILCVAEKPSIAKEVSQILSGGLVRVRNSANRYVKNYDFTFEFPTTGRCDVTMTSVLGHITNIDFPPAYSWNKCVPGKLFTAPIIEVVSKKDVYKNIASEARNATNLMIWTDCDREGEFIGHEIFQAAQLGNPRLRVDEIWRSQFSHLERSHVLHAARNPVKLDLNAVAAVGCRMEIDLRVGAGFTRFLSDLLKRSGAIPLEKGQVVSYGTCQFPTLGFVVDRYTRVKNFVSEPFWHISIRVKKDDKIAPFTWTTGHVFDHLYGFLAYQACLQHKDATVTSITTKPTSNWRPLPLTTVELQKDCSSFFKMSAKRALDAAEKLYNKGFLSYPRTETDKFPPTMDLRSVIHTQAQDSQWGTYASELLQGKFRQPRAGNHDDKAHPPIHPVKYVALSALDSADEKKIYEYVVRRFLACCSDDARGNQTKAIVQWGAEKFSASGLAVTERNYLDIYIYKKWLSTVELPNFQQGDKVKLTSSQLQEGKTSPPKYMTESELIALMDANGIGTDATIADHIDKIINRGYVVKVKQGSTEYILPSEFGMGLIQGFDAIEIDNISLSKPFLRKQLETSLQQVVNGTASKQSVLDAIVHLYKQAYSQSTQNGQVIVQACRRVMNR
jgi:DNA topoisomerase-3